MYDSKGKKLGELVNLPVKCNTGHTVTLGEKMYLIARVYDSKIPREEKSEVIYYELCPYKYQADFDLGELLPKKEQSEKFRLI